MTPRIVTFASLLLVSVLTLVAEPAATKLKVRVTHFGFPGDSTATRNTRLGLGDHNNILNADSVAVTPDLDKIFPYGSKVYIEGTFLGLRHATLGATLHHTIAVYDPTGEWKGDFDSEVEPSATKRPNQAMQPTPGRRTLKISMTPTSTPAATRVLASGG